MRKILSNREGTKCITRLNAVVGNTVIVQGLGWVMVGNGDITDTGSGVGYITEVAAAVVAAGADVIMEESTTGRVALTTSLSSGVSLAKRKLSLN